MNKMVDILYLLWGTVVSDFMTLGIGWDFLIWQWVMSILLRSGITFMVLYVHFQSVSLQGAKADCCWSCRYSSDGCGKRPHTHRYGMVPLTCTLCSECRSFGLWKFLFYPFQALATFRSPVFCRWHFEIWNLRCKVGGKEYLLSAAALMLLTLTLGVFPYFQSQHLAWT